MCLPTAPDVMPAEKLQLEPPPPPPRNRAQSTGPPKILPRLTPQAPEVTWAQHSAENENGTFGISASRGFRKGIICHVFGENFATIFNAQKIFQHLWRQSS